MINFKNHHYIAIKWAVTFATFGLLTALGIMFILGLIKLISNVYTSIITGIMGLYSSAIFLGYFAGEFIFRFRLQANKARLVGILSAYLCVVISCLSGSSVEYFSSHINSWSFFNYIVKPFVWISIFALIPATILGFKYAGIVRKKLVPGNYLHESFRNHKVD